MKISDDDALGWVQRHETDANQRAREDGGLYASHREHLTKVIASLGGQRRRLCLLGAGNCNDVALSALLERFSEIHLVDIDPSAVEHAIERQPRDVHSRLFTHAPRDISGLLADLPDLLLAATADDMTAEKYGAMLWSIMTKRTMELLLGLPGPFDVAVSCCVTTQLAVSLEALVTERHPRFEALRRAMLMIHLRTLARIGHVALWVSDVSSSEIHPLEEALKTESPSDLLRRLSDAGVIHRSGNPEFIDRIMATDPLLADIRRLDKYEPWVWRTRHKTFLVQAVRYGAASNTPDAPTPKS